MILDIEISPTLATVWGLWNQNLSIDKIIGNSEVLTWAAAWEGSDEIMYSSRGFASKKSMLKDIYNLLEEADVVVTYNGDRFDLPVLNMEFLLQGWTPPAPYKSVDLLKTMKKRFRGSSNKLDYWLKRLGLDQKSKHRGHQMWLDCMNGDKAAFEEMSQYNRDDVDRTEQLFQKIRPWIVNLPNLATVSEDGFACPACGSKHLHNRGTRTTKTHTYERYRCVDCGHWSRATQANKTTKAKVVSLIDG